MVFPLTSLQMVFATFLFPLTFLFRAYLLFILHYYNFSSSSLHKALMHLTKTLKNSMHVS